MLLPRTLSMGFHTMRQSSASLGLVLDLEVAQACQRAHTHTHTHAQGTHMYRDWRSWNSSHREALLISQLANGVGCCRALCFSLSLPTMQRLLLELVWMCTLVSLPTFAIHGPQPYACVVSSKMLHWDCMHVCACVCVRERMLSNGNLHAVHMWML